MAVEAFAGTEVRGELPLSSPIYELDGTSAGSRDPATRPAQNAVLRPLVGRGHRGRRRGHGRWALRLAYRRVWSATAGSAAGRARRAASTTRSSALTGNAAWRDRDRTSSGGVRLNLLLGEFDDQQLALRLRLAATQWLTLEYTYLAPTFDGDSIWNVFATGPYRDLRASYEIGLGPEVKAYARGFVRLFEATRRSRRRPLRGAGRSGRGAGRLAAGGSLGATWRRGRGFLRADGYCGRRLRRPQDRRRRRGAARGAARVRARGAPHRLRLARRTSTLGDRRRRRVRRAGGRPLPARAGGARCTCSPRTTSAPATRASSAAWRCWRWTRRYEALADVVVTGARPPRSRRPACIARAGFASAVAGDDRGGAGRAGGAAGAVAAHLPGRDDPAQVRSRAARAPGRDLRGLPRRRRRPRRSRPTT